MNVNKTYKIGTVETLKVKKSGRRFYVNLDADTIVAFGIKTGDILKVKIEEGFKAPAPGDN